MITIKTKGFTQISNEVIRDTKLSMTALGLYNRIASMINIPNFRIFKSFFQNEAKDEMGRDKFDKVWNELKTKGYLTQTRKKDANGCFYYEYSLAGMVNNTTYGFTNNGKNPQLNNTSYFVGENNIYINNNSENIRSIPKTFSDEFFSKLEGNVVVDEKVKERLNKFFDILNRYEKNKLSQSSQIVFINFYNKAVEVFSDEEIKNPEGYLRTIVRGKLNCIQAKIKSQKKEIHHFIEPTYDDSKNKNASPEDIEALLKARSEQQDLPIQSQRELKCLDTTSKHFSPFPEEIYEDEHFEDVSKEYLITNAQIEQIDSYVKTIDGIDGSGQEVLNEILKEYEIDRIEDLAIQNASKVIEQLSKTAKIKCREKINSQNSMLEFAF